MKVARIAVLAVALGAGVVAWSLARNLGSGDEAPVIVEQTIETDQVLAAAHALEPGKAVVAADLSWQTWPADSIGAGLVRKSSKPDAIKDVAGSVTRASFVDGEPIRESKLVRAGPGGYLPLACLT